MRRFDTTIRRKSSTDAIQWQVPIPAFADLVAERGDRGVGADDHDGVARHRTPAATGHRHLAVVLDPAEPDLRESITELGERRQRRLP